MTSQFSPNVSQILAFSKEEAMRLSSKAVGPEHLLLGILREKESLLGRMFLMMDVNPQTVKKELEKKIQETDSKINGPVMDIMLTDKASNILKLAVLEARLQRTQTVDVQHLVLAILHDSSENGAKEILENNNMDYDNTLKFFKSQTNQVRNGIGLPEDDDLLDEQAGSAKETKGTHSATAVKGKNTKTPVLDNFSTDLTQAALDGKLDPVIGRENEIMRVTEILNRRKKNNPILIGEPGVGKSAIAEGLAQLIAKRQTSPLLFGKRIVSLDMTSIVAGTKYRGQFEERIQALLKELEENSDIIVFIDEIHTLVGAGSTPGSMDAANIMKPALARGTIQCIGATTLDEYRNSIEKDGALERRFQKVMVEPTTPEQTLDILQNIKDRYETHHLVEYTDDALKACVKLTERYITDRCFPDKAIDALDEVGAKVHLKNTSVPPFYEEMQKAIDDTKTQKMCAVKEQNFELAARIRDKQVALEKEFEDLCVEYLKDKKENRITVTETEVAEVVSIMSGVPVQRVAESEGIRLKGMAESLRQVVVAQDKAIDKMVKAILRNRVGLKDPNHPIGVFMFLGPTGVGKTYLAKELARFMFGSTDALIRVDMSEYTESFNVSRLVGPPPGYVGYEEGGQLTEKVRRHPYSIVLLDEIEKAHGNVFNLLLQVLDEGRLTDGNGRLVDFRNTVIIMTSNAGTRQLKDFGRGIGFTATSFGSDIDESDKEYARSIIQKTLSKQFAPEFLNRLDEIITFDQLDKNAIKSITDIELGKLLRRMEGLGYSVEVSEKARELIASKGYDVQFGARPLKRAIQSYVEDGLCEMILTDELQKGSKIIVDREDGAEKLSFRAEQ
ncbi:MAG: ATP-dependent Clp protease ATP-binding subunit [Prevotella sp.]